MHITDTSYLAATVEFIPIKPPVNVWVSSSIMQANISLTVQEPYHKKFTTKSTGYVVVDFLIEV